MKHNHTKILALVAVFAAPVMTLAQEKNEEGVLPPETLHVVYEAFSLPMSEAAKLLRAGLTDELFYGKMMAGLKDKSVKQEVFLVARQMSGIVVSVKNVAEHIYPTEVEPPDLPNVVNNTALKDGENALRVFPAIPATSKAFDTQDVGNTLKIGSSITNDEGHIDLRIAPKIVTFIERQKWGQGLSEFETSRFAIQQIETGVIAKSGQTSFLGTLSPPKELQAKEGEQSVWFAFVTVSIVVQ